VFEIIEVPGKEILAKPIPNRREGRTVLNDRGRGDRGTKNL